MPKSANGAGTIRHRSDGRWQAIITLGVDHATGKQIRKSIYGKTQKQVKQAMMQTITMLDKGTYIQPTKMTLQQWLKTWYEDYCINIKPYTRSNYQGAINKIIGHIGHIKLVDVNPTMLQHIINEWSKEYSSSTVHSYIRIYKVALNKAVQLEYIAKNPLTKCKLPVYSTQQMSVLTGEKLKQFLQVIKGDKFQDMLILAVFSGLRCGQYLGLTWDEVDFQNGCLNIKHQLQWGKIASQGYKFITPKSGHGRIVAVAPFVMERLADIKAKQEQLKAKPHSIFNNKQNLVFCNEIGYPYRECVVYRHLKQAVITIGMPTFRLHDLRHTYATLSLQNGDNLKTVSEQLGHSSTQITGRVYAHVTEKLRKDSSDRMQKLIDSLND